jgi:hypothetical protein
MPELRIVLIWVAVVGLWLLLWLVIRGLNRRDRRQLAVQAQLREMEHQIWRDSLPDEQRAALEDAAQQRREIAREALAAAGLTGGRAMMDPQSPMTIALVTIAGLAVGVLPACAVLWWLDRRTSRQIVQAAAARQRRWHAEQAERRRQWADRDRRQAVQQQQRDLAQQIWRESLPDWQREALDAADRKQVGIAQEARRRLGLPEEEA